jgi:hypothetical protein
MIDTDPQSGNGFIDAATLRELERLARSRPRSGRQAQAKASALRALESIPPRLDTRLLFPAERGGPLNLDNFRRREWGPAVDTAGIARPARIYDLRSTYASNSLAAGIDVFELARVMGTSIEMIERHYGTLLTGAAAGIAERQAAFETAQDEAGDTAGDV